jgi:hypothetical protein
MEQLISAGRSTPGNAHKNDASIDLYKVTLPAHSKQEYKEAVAAQKAKEGKKNKSAN